MSEGITSPPYPRLTATSTSLYFRLGELRDWVLEEMRNLSQDVPEQVEMIKVPDPIPLITVWENVSVADKFAVLTHARHVRESWDHIIREHEDAWDSALAIKKRLMLVNSASLGLDEAFVDPETREAREQKQVDHINKKMRVVRQMIGRALTPEGIFGPDDEEED
jgi:hypothetical protein